MSVSFLKVWLLIDNWEKPHGRLGGNSGSLAFGLSCFAICTVFWSHQKFLFIYIHFQKFFSIINPFSSYFSHFWMMVHWKWYCWKKNKNIEGYQTLPFTYRVEPGRIGWRGWSDNLKTWNYSIKPCHTSPHSTTDGFLSVFSFRLCFDKNLWTRHKSSMRLAKIFGRKQDCCRPALVRKHIP